MTVEEIQALATELGYSISGETKSELIDSFLAVQSGEAESSQESQDNTPEVTHVYTEEELTEMTVAQIEALATELGYDIGSGTKAEKIAAFLAAQEAAGENAGTE